MGFESDATRTMLIALLAESSGTLMMTRCARA